jgi:hypothetical protein
MTKLTPLHAGNWIELPPDWAAEIGLHHYAALEKTEAGILIHPSPVSTWDGVFAQKLCSELTPDSAAPVEASGDSVLL